MVALSALPCSVAQAATDGLNIGAKILASALALTGTQNLNFGAFTNSGGGGSVTIPLAGAGTYLGVMQIAGPAETPGKVLISGNSGASIEVKVLSASIPVTHSTNGQTMVVGTFDINGQGQTATITMAGTTTSLPIGAKLTVPAAKPAGTYTGTFTVEAVYN